MSANDLMTVGELRDWLKIYDDSYYISFGDRYLTKIDTRDTDTIHCEWIEKWEDEAMNKPVNYYQNFEKLESRAETLLRKYAQKEVAEGITVNWIFPYPINEQLRDMFRRCYHARVPFCEYFKTMYGHPSEIYVVDMNGKWHELSTLSMIV